jgi:hypothetical protein
MSGINLYTLEPNDIWMTQLSVVDDFSVHVLVNLLPTRELLHSHHFARLPVAHQVDNAKITASKLLNKLILLHVSADSRTDRTIDAVNG